MTDAAQNETPYISFVIVARNDNYGQNQAARLQLSIGTLLEQLEEFRLDSEIILVDWNAPEDKPPVYELIDWPKDTTYCSIKSYTVAPRHHSRYLYHDLCPFFTSAAFNAGVRRALGQFVLPKVSDTLYPDELVELIAQKKLNPQHRYRVNRCDVSADVLNLSFDSRQSRIEFCKRNILQEYAYYPVKAPFPVLHTDACGDFQLMHRDHWHHLRGFWERDTLSGHSDTLLSYSSLAIGIKEVIIAERTHAAAPQQHSAALSPMRIYKITHDNQFSAREQKNTVPVLSFQECVTIFREVLQGQRSYQFNDSNWGLGDEELFMHVIRRALWEET